MHKQRPTSLTICSGGRSVFWPASINHSPGVVLHNASTQLRSNFHIPQITDHGNLLCSAQTQRRTRRQVLWLASCNKSPKTVIEHHNKTAMMSKNSQMSRLQGRGSGPYVIVEISVSTCPSTQLCHITCWGCKTSWGCKTYTCPFKGDVMHCTNEYEKQIVPISQKVLELGHALIP